MFVLTFRQTLILCCVQNARAENVACAMHPCDDLCEWYCNVDANHKQFFCSNHMDEHIRAMKRKQKHQKPQPTWCESTHTKNFGDNFLVYRKFRDIVSSDSSERRTIAEVAKLFPSELDVVFSSCTDIFFSTCVQFIWPTMYTDHVRCNVYNCPTRQNPVVSCKGSFLCAKHASGDKHANCQDHTGQFRLAVSLTTSKMQALAKRPATIELPDSSDDSEDSERNDDGDVQVRHQCSTSLRQIMSDGGNSSRKEYLLYSSFRELYPLIIRRRLQFCCRLSKSCIPGLAMCHRSSKRHVQTPNVRLNQNLGWRKKRPQLHCYQAFRVIYLHPWRYQMI